ncbi:hypothetical protein EK21DRAFT_112192 [Setomelanomma holmii]|uniref:Uncharacterized protein n=1 Tax=Setomelanomma holmii TaxID=210430 RepID=A0A9P4HAY2_9PLEO|nr:hypothetical protein EK21DRAFT_112192 [Setomelanomma holmii]
MPPGDGKSAKFGIIAGALPQKCYALNLAGEFRNRTYYFATDAERITYLGGWFKQMPDAELASYYSIARCDPCHQTLALTCRQIRAEYLMIYAAGAEVHVPDTVLYYFLKADCSFMFRN